MLFLSFYYTFIKFDWRKSNKQPAKSNEQRVESNEQEAESNEQQGTSSALLNLEKDL